MMHVDVRPQHQQSHRCSTTGMVISSALRALPPSSRGSANDIAKSAFIPGTLMRIACQAQGIVVGMVPHQLMVALVGSPMACNASSYKSSSMQAKGIAAKRMLGEESLAVATPALSVFFPCSFTFDGVGFTVARVSEYAA
jgi:hypothetical protein